MPGGMKFISFLLEFVNFISHELVKQKEKQLNLVANQYRDHISESSLHKICAKNAVFKEMASRFLDTIETLNTKYDEKSQKIMEQLQILSQETGLSVDTLTDDKFLQDFEESNKKLFEQHYNKRTQKVLELDNIIKELKETMDIFYSRETGYKYDKQRLCMQLRRIKEHFPIEEPQDDSFSSKPTNEGAKINNLISVFNAINGTIQKELKIVNERPCPGEFVCSRLLTLKKDFQEIEKQVMEFQKMLNANIKTDRTEYPQTPVRTDISDVTKHILQNNLIMKLVSTPPIKLEVPEGGGKSRLALVDVRTNINETTFNNFLAPPRSNIIRNVNRHNSFLDQSLPDLNNTINRSKIIDPMQLLRSTSKKDTSKHKLITMPQANISNLGAKWKLRQTMMFNDNDDDEATSSCTLNTPKMQINAIDVSKTSPHLPTTTASTTILHQSPFTPLTSNDRTRIARSQSNFDSSACLAINNSSATSLSYIKKPSAVKKVQYASVNLSTSPSGRLEPLVTVEDFDIPKLKLNDLPLKEHNSGNNNTTLVETEINLEQFSPVNDIKVNVENNPNAIIEGRNDVTKKYEDEEEDALFDTSDSVLKDVTL